MDSITPSKTARDWKTRLDYSLDYSVHKSREGHPWYEALRSMAMPKKPKPDPVITELQRLLSVFTLAEFTALVKMRDRVTRGFYADDMRAA